jgi:PAS domain S-box-containing protein
MQQVPKSATQTINYDSAEQTINSTHDKELMQMKLALDHTTIVAITNLQGIITYVNHKFCEISQYSPSELIGQNHSLINSGYHPKSFFQKMWTTIAQGKIWRDEICNRAKDGTLYWVDTSIIPFLDNDGNITGFLGIANDITQRKRTEEELQKLFLYELEISRFFTLSLDMLCIANFEGYFIQLNPTWEDVLGYTQAELMAQPYIEFVHVDDRERTLAEARKLEIGIKTIKFENRYLCKDGSYRWLEWSVAPFGEQGLLYCTARDNTKRKQLEIALQAEVKKRIRIEYDLRLLTTKLEQSNRELQDFAYVASHDLQEPLRKIQTFSDRLKSKFGDVLTEQGKDYLERMQNAAKRSQNLINDLLAFSRVTTKAKAFTVIDLMDVLKGVLSDLEVKIEQLHAQIEIEDLREIEADPLQMQQLFQNLIGNALKFHRLDITPIIRIQGQVLESHDINSPSDLEITQWYQITIADNGIGFEEKYVDRIFNVFQRLHNRDTYEGTGVGLAICRKIVERHHGELTAHSVLGTGSTFMITLPLQQVAQDGFSGE